MYNCKEMHLQHQKGIPLTIPKDPVDDQKTYRVKNIEEK